MTCNRCGRRAQGQLCRDCERDEMWADELDALDDRLDETDDDDDDAGGAPRPIPDGGETVETDWTLTCLDCDFEAEFTTEGHPRDGPPEAVEKRVTAHKHTTDQSHVVRVEGRRADRDDEIDPSLLTDGGQRVCSRCGTDSEDVAQVGHSLAEANDPDNPLLCPDCDREVSR